VFLNATMKAVAVPSGTGDDARVVTFSGYAAP
jgi:hypothetical protein